MNCLLVIAIVIAAPAFAGKKVALVIGNNNYQNVPSLDKAVNDASTIAKVLKQSGFEVLQSSDATRLAFNRKIQDFINKVEPGDTAMFYYAGHGIEIKGQNYLLPVDIPAAKSRQEELVKAESIGLGSILDRIQNRRAQVNIVVLDACRNNPFVNSHQRGVGSSRGLAVSPPPEGTFILYSAGAGQTALDALSGTDEDPNSVFTRVLAPLILKPDIKLPDMAKEVRRKVKKLASTVSHKQTPAFYDQMIGDYFFTESRGRGKQKQADTSIPPSDLESKPNQSGAMELELWKSVKNSENAAYLESYVQRYPNGTFVYLARVKIEALQAESGPTKNPYPIQTSIEGQLQLCDEHLEANRLTTGIGGNAYDCYMGILRDAPQSQAANSAISGIERIENKYASWARIFLNQGDLNLAKNTINKLNGINSESAEGRELMTMLSAKLIKEAFNLINQSKWLESLYAFEGLRLVDEQSSIAVGAIAILNYLGRGEVEKNKPLADTLGLEAQSLGIETLAEAGDSSAQLILAKLYIDGIGIRQNKLKAIEWYKRSADQNNYFALAELGWVYENGEGVSTNKATAIEWYTRAAQLGSSFGKMSLARLNLQTAVVKNTSPKKEDLRVVPTKKMQEVEESESQKRKEAMQIAYTKFQNYKVAKTKDIVNPDQDTAARAWGAAIGGISGAAIGQHVSSNYRYNPSCSGRKSSWLITSTPTGQILNIKMSDSSGNDTCDREAGLAIKNSNPLPIKVNSPTAESEEFRFNFQPE